MLKDELARIERLARINREKSLGKQGSKALDKESFQRYIPKQDEKSDGMIKEDKRYDGSDRLFDEERRKPRN